MNTRQKGRRHELECKHSLESLDWKVIISPTPQRWQKQRDGGTDFFGLFDLIAVNNLGAIRYIQVKSNNDTTGRKWKEEARFFKENPLASVEIWVYKDRVKEPIIKVI